MWINDKVTYTPEVVEVKKGEPVTATVKAVSSIGGMLTIVLPDGREERVEARLCKKE